MRPSRRCLAAALTLFVCAPGLLTAQQAGGAYRLAGGNYALYNLAGAVSIRAGSGAQLAVTVQPKGADAAALRVATGEIRGRSTLRVLYPSGNVVYQGMAGDGETTIRVQDDGTFGDDDTFGGGIGRGHTVSLRSSGSGTHASADLEVLLPPGATLDLHLGAGSVLVRNVEGHLSLDVAEAEVDVDGVTGDFSLDSGSGAVTFSRVRGKSVSLDTGSGSITGSAISATRFSLDAGSGDVNLSKISADVLDLDTGSGNLTLSLDTDVDTLTLDAGSGDVTIYVPRSLGAKLEVDAGSGGVDVRLPLANRHQDEDDESLTGTLGDGNGQIKIDSGSGTVRILPR